MKVKIEKVKRPILKNSTAHLGVFDKDFLWAYHPCVLKKGKRFYMFYTGKGLSRGIAHDILLATGNDLFSWKKHKNSPIIEKGVEGEWDSDFLAHSFVFQDKGRYYMLYDGSRKGEWLEEIGLAQSKDLVRWKKYKNNPIFKVGKNWWEKRHVSRCFVYKDKAYYYLYYAGHDGERERIGVAGGRDFTKLKRLFKDPVLDVGKKNDWDGRSISDPRIIKFGSKYLMFYSGIDKLGVERMGMAESKDLVCWKKYRGNPILDVNSKSWDKISATRADIKIINGEIHVFYSGRKRLFYNIGLAKLKIS